MEHAEAVAIGGGRSGLAAAHALVGAGLKPLVLETSDRAAGSWPHYYDSLTLSSPARFSALPGLPLDREGDRYPHRDEAVAHLARHASRLDAEIRTGSRVARVTAEAGGAFRIELADGRVLTAGAAVAASGSFANPYRPALPSLGPFAGRTLHGPTTGIPRRSPGSGSWWWERATPRSRSPPNSPAPAAPP